MHLVVNHSELSCLLECCYGRHSGMQEGSGVSNKVQSLILQAFHPNAPGYYHSHLYCYKYEEGMEIMFVPGVTPLAGTPQFPGQFIAYYSITECTVYCSFSLLAAFCQLGHLGIIINVALY